MSTKYEKNIYLAMLAEQCTRYEDMMAFLEDMVKIKSGDLSSDERNLLSIAYKNTISLDRQAIRTLSAYESKEAKKTDSPYLAPEPHRGHRNDSRELIYVVEKIAEIKGMTPEEVEDITWDNALRLFQL